MKILMHLAAAHRTSGGGAIAMFRLKRGLEELGHSVTFSATDRTANPRSEVGELRSEIFTRKTMNMHDLLLTTASQTTSYARREARLCKKPIITCCHSLQNLDLHLDTDLLVWGSRAQKRTAKDVLDFDPSAEEMVMWPLIWPDEVRTTPGNHVTLVNLSLSKGAELFTAVAKMMPHVPFLGVKGGWGKQIKEEDLPLNVRVMPWVEDPRIIFAQTQILLFFMGKTNNPAMWLQGVGMTALEAACSGIPTLAHHGPGLAESLEGSGVVWLYDHDPEVAAEKLHNLRCDIGMRSARSFQHANRVLDPRQALLRFEERMMTL